jgi:hypothetical protein
VLELIRWAIREIRSRLAQSWPTVSGIVESAEVRVDSFSTNQRYTPEVTYSYQVDGDFYSGSHIVSSGKKLAPFPKGLPVVVHYKASDPSTSFLDRENLRIPKNLMAASSSS